MGCRLISLRTVLTEAGELYLGGGEDVGVR